VRASGVLTRAAAALLFLPLLLLLSGCGSSGDGDDQVPIFVSDGRVTSFDSDLVLNIPSGLAVDEATLRDLYNRAIREPGCRTSDGSALDLVLADACLLFHRFYLFPQDRPASLDGILDAAAYVARIGAIDPFAFYLPPESFSASLPSILGERATVGFQFSLGEGPASEANPVTVTSIVPLSRAWFDGLQAGDRILSVDGIPVEGLTLAEFRTLLPVQEGEAVLLGVARGAEAMEIATSSEEHFGRLAGAGGDIAYLRVKQFTTLTARRVMEDLDALRLQGASDRLILDLRGNGGGSLTGALALADFLIDRDLPPRTNPLLVQDGTILTDATDYLGEFSARNLEGIDASRFVVLMDGASASSSELTIAALRDYGLATLMGQRSFGKGVSQNIFALMDGSGVFIPSHHLLPPSGRSWHLSGIEPQVAVPATPLSPLEDPALAAAVAFLETGALPAAKARPEAAPAAKADPWLEQRSREER